MEDISTFLSRAIDQNGKLQDLQSGALVQISKRFNIAADGLTHNQLNAKLKSKILDLFITQGDQYKDYLQLPKFKNMNSSNYQIILTIFDQIWKDASKFKKHSQMTEIEKEFNFLKPQLDSHMDIQNFHLELLQNYKKSKLCPHKTEEILIEKLNQKQFEFPFYPRISINPINNFYKNQVQPKLQNVQQSSPLNISHRSQISQQPLSNLDPFNRSSMNWSTIDYASNLRRQQPYNSQYFTYRTPSYQLNNFNPFSLNQSQNQNEIVEDQNEIVEEEQQQKNYFDMDTEQVNEQFRQYKFINCYCQGLEKYEKYFSCQSCNFRIHYQCFGKSEEGFKQKICPFCMLKKSNMFLRIDQNPLFQSYYLLKQGTKFQIKLSQNTINEIKKRIKQNSKKVYLRVLKCSGKRQKYNQGKNSQSKLKCIEIPNNFLQNFTTQKNMLVDISTSSQSLEQSEKIFVFGLYFQKNKTPQQYVRDLIQSKQNITDVQFLQNLRERSQEKTITLNIIDNASGQQIVCPVRGDQCEHAQVFDYKHYLQLIKELGKQSLEDIECDLCSKKITKFLLDSYVFQKLATVPDDKKTIGIIYKGKQNFEWKYQEDDQQQQQMDQNSRQISQKKSNSLESQS